MAISKLHVKISKIFIAAFISQDIQLEENRLENETKLLNLETKQHDLEYKRRLYPDADLSNEEMTVNSLQKYLV